MKSICIKTNHPETIEYLLEKLDNSNIEYLYFSCKKFRFYKNIIIHFTGKNEQLFLREISKLLSYLVIDLFEETIVNKIGGEVIG